MKLEGGTKAPCNLATKYCLQTS